MRLIGVELRLQYTNPYRGNMQEEIALLPCNVIVELPEEVTAANWSNAQFNATLHTDYGDFNLVPAHTVAVNCFDSKETAKRGKVK